MTSAPVQNRITGKITATITLGNTSGVAQSGPFLVHLTNLTPGVTLENASGMKDGKPYIVLSNVSIAAGAKASIGVVFTNPTRGGLSYTPKVFSGPY